MLARQMEVYAGFLEHTDHHVGRLVDALQDLGVLDDTLVYYIIGDNGASRRGHRQRIVQRDLHLQRRRRPRDARVRGRAHRRVRHARRRTTTTRWAGRTRMDTPVPVDQAGRLALGRHPQRHHRPLAERASRPRARCGHQFHHVIDVAPTILEAAGLPEPTRCRRRAAAPHRGREHAVLLRRRRCRRPARRRSTSRCSATAASTTRAGPPSPGTAPPGSSSRCPPSTTTSGSSTTRTRTGARRTTWRARYPEKLAELQALWLDEARKYNVLPLDDRRIERFNADLAGARADPRQLPAAVRRHGAPEREPA